MLHLSIRATVHFKLYSCSNLRANIFGRRTDKRQVLVTRWPFISVIYGYPVMFTKLYN